MDSTQKSQLDTFVWETREHLDRLEPDILELQRDPQNSALINGIFRGVHSIKGGAGFFGFDPIQRLSHGLEHVMTRVRDGEQAVNSDVMDLLLAGVDKLRAMIDDPESSDVVDIAAEEALIERLSQADRPAEASAVAVGCAAADDLVRIFKVSSEQVADVAKKGLFVYRADFYPSDHKAGGNDAGFIARAESVGEVLDAVTHVRESADDQAPECALLFASVLQEDMVDIALDIPREQYQPIPIDILKNHAQREPKQEEPSGRMEQPPAAVPAVHRKGGNEQAGGERTDGPFQARKVEESVRLPVSLLDELMDLAGELVLGRNQLLMLADDVKDEINGFVPALRNIDRVATGLRDKVMSTRLQPLGNLFVKFQRIIRDLAADLGKQIDLKISGAEVELDKSLIEILSDPLMHIVRNCADHGLEPPSERERLGKPPMGRITLEASHQAGRVFVRVADDGRGMDADRVRAKAVERGLVRAEDAEGMSTRQVLRFIFTPGFSTADQVSNVSGRGVGMDVVKSNIEKVGGSIDIDSRLGQGTVITLCLPLTVAVVPAMIVRVKDRLFAVPQVHLEELVKLRADLPLSQVRGADVLRLRDRLLPVVDMAELLELQEDDPARIHRRTGGYVAVMKNNQDRFGLLLDELLDEEEIVVKALNEHLKACPCYSGSTILGDGRIVLILDTAGIVNYAGLEFMEADNEHLARQEELQRRQVTETQHLLLFRNAESDLFAINQELVHRIEKVRTADIRRVAQKEFVTYRDEALRLIRLEDYLPVDGPAEEPEFVYILVPKLVKKPMGIVCTAVEDAVDVNVELDHVNIKGTGVMGSAVLDDRVTVFLDIYSLFEAVDPHTYRWDQGESVLRGRRILLAEDTVFFRALVSQYLESLNCRVDVAQDGIEAWDMLRHRRYDMLVTDLEMPGMDGFELTEHVRASDRLRDMPIVALSSISKERYLTRALEAGVDAYESKIDKEQLRTTLENLALQLEHEQERPTVEQVTAGSRQGSMVDLELFEPRDKQREGRS
jgi:two-component system chemotaxis sensor kinase CheA